ncbi:outer membrane protein assembly factor BamB family protein [Salinigranum halophilum]|uniref:serine/threonine-protein kinase n=1 Tax=Salinigranum halophilum TaxID=2565931 RepID=UPI001375F20F|nr:serine/threonine-protein kinase [Salinigranum halophilum]
MADPRIPDLSTVASPPQRKISYEQLQDGKLLGSGGNAIVTRFELDGPPPNTVAVKEPRSPVDTIDTETAEAFIAEAQTWSRLDAIERNRPLFADCEHIVGIIDVGENLPWIAMEYMDGGSLENVLTSHPDGLPVAEALWIGECLCRGVKLAHDFGVAHLDLKPANVLFRTTPDDLWNIPKIADWGLSRVLLDESGSVDGLSVAYAAPEQFDAQQFGTPDKYTDIYQLGALVYALLTGNPPYTGGQASVMHNVVYGEAPAPPSARRDGLSATIDEAVLTALETSKPERFHGEVKRLEEELHRAREERTNTTASTSATPAETSTDEAQTRSNQQEETDEEPAAVDTQTENSTSTQHDWPMYRRTPSRWGHNPLTTGPNSPVTARWTYETGDLIQKSPVIVSDTVYVGSDDGFVYALDAETGEKKWGFQANARVRSSPAVVDGTVYVGVSEYMYALSADDGSKLWRFETDGEVYSSPTVVDDTIYFGSDDSRIYAVSKEGIENWTVETEGNVRQSPAVADESLYIGSGNDLYALGLNGGAERWQVRLENESVRGMFYVKGRYQSSPVVRNETVYAQGSNLYALSTENGDQNWHSNKSKHSVPPVVTDNTIYTIGSGGIIHALNANDRSNRWSQQLEYDVGGSPTVAGATVYIGSLDKNLYAFSTVDGMEQWRFESKGRVRSSPVVSDRTVYFNSGSKVYAVSSE